MIEYEIHVIYDSDEYEQELNLRNRILRIPLGLDLFLEDLSDEIDDVHIGAFINSTIAGCLVLKDCGDRSLKMRQVAVDKRYQGFGIGAAMVEFAERYAKKNGFKEINMHARKSAISFYKRLGYVLEGGEFTEVNIPHHVMKKKLK